MLYLLSFVFLRSFCIYWYLYVRFGQLSYIKSVTRSDISSGFIPFSPAKYQHWLFICWMVTLDQINSSKTLLKSRINESFDLMISSHPVDTYFSYEVPYALHMPTSRMVSFVNVSCIHNMFVLISLCGWRIILLCYWVVS